MKIPETTTMAALAEATLGDRTNPLLCLVTQGCQGMCSHSRCVGSFREDFSGKLFQCKC
jgi:hypothetical protein